ncbi:MAG: MaoC family dehydratase [Candidatus Rokubacteria bacterium]|nr:MaoC family dehydratase [Candidatus Rokubacteria bacterium]
MIGRTIDELAVGDAAEVSRVVTASDIAGFVDSVGDRNPIHSNPAFAATTRFGEPIAPGIWTAGLISGVLGTRLPGPGTLYETQELRFLRPVRVGDTITARVEVVDILRERNRVRVKTTCVNQLGEEVLAGEAGVLPPRTTISYVADELRVAGLGFWVLQPWAWAVRALLLWATWAALPFGAGSPSPPR